jgi:hypothetical protein
MSIHAGVSKKKKKKAKLLLATQGQFKIVLVITARWQLQSRSFQTSKPPPD